MSEQAHTQLDGDTILEFLNTHQADLRAMGVKKIGLFGSLVRGQQTKTSDVDLVFTMEHFTWAGWMDLWNYLEDHLGVEIDLIPEKDLREELRAEVLSEVKYAVEELINTLENDIDS